MWEDEERPARETQDVPPSPLSLLSTLFFPLSSPSSSSFLEKCGSVLSAFGWFPSRINQGIAKRPRERINTLGWYLICVENGKEREGKERKGKERKGKERKGKEKEKGKGKERKGKKRTPLTEMP